MSGRGRTPVAEIARAADVLVHDYMAIEAREAVLITADTASDPALTEALLASVQRAGARGAVLTIPRLPYQGSLADPYIPPPVSVKLTLTWVASMSVRIRRIPRLFIASRLFLITL